MNRKVLILAAVASLAAIAAVGDAAAQIPSGLIINGEGTAEMTWTLPTQNTDGSALAPAQRAGYVLFYGNQSRFSSGTTPRAGCTAKPPGPTSTTCYGAFSQINNGSQTSTTLTLPLNASTTIYFAATTLATNGQYSDYSNEAAKIFTLEVEDSRVPNPPVIESINVTMTCTTNDPGFTCRFTVQ